MKILLIAIILTIITISFQQNCQANMQNDQFMTGSYMFILNTGNMKKNCYNLPSNGLIKSTSSISYGINQINSYSNTNNLDFSLRAHIQTNNSISFILILHNNTWNRLSISFLVSNRIQFISDSVIADTNDLSDCQEKSSSLLNIKINKNIPQVRGAAILIYINGLRSSSPFLDVQISQPLIDYNLSQINTTISTIVPKFIELIYLNYLIIDISRLSAQYSISFTVSPVINDFSVSGIISISNMNSSVQYAYTNINKINKFSCSGLNCDNCQSVQSCRQINGNIFDNKCLRCSLNQIFSNNQGCICRDGFFRTSRGCQTCQQGTVFNIQRQTCETICRINEFYSNGRCQCNNGFFNVSNVCRICQDGTIYNRQRQTCDPICRINQFYFNGRCQCNSGFYNISNVCRICQEGTVYNSVSMTCLSICTGGQQYFNGKCSCINGQYLIGNTCGTCPPGTILNIQSNQCSNLCNLPNQIFSNGNCICNIGYMMVNRQCIIDTRNQNNNCLNNQNKYRINGQCKCFPNFFLYQNNCYNCPANSSPTINQDRCVCNIGFVLSNYACVFANSLSPSSSTLSSSTGSSNIGNRPSGSSGFSGSSGASGASSSSSSSGSSGFSGSLGSSGSSSSGFSGSSNNNHQSSSSSSSISVSGLTQLSGSIRIEGSTSGGSGIQSGSNDQANFSGFFESNANRQGNNNQISSHGSSGSSQSNSNRQFINNNQINSQGSSTINTINNFMCPPNSYLLNNQCVCSPNFFLINGSCDRCPINTFYTSGKCQQCKDNCRTCVNKNICTQCYNGFILNYPPNLQFLQTNCSQICGDGRRFVHACDDGNDVNGDGCSSTCNVELGWSCSGGSSNSRDTCRPMSSSSISITFLRNVRFINAVYQNLMIGPLPNNFTQNNCPNCNNLIKLQVLSAPPGTRFIINFIKNTFYQYVIAIVLPPNFTPTNTNNIVTISASLNPLYQRFFTQSQMNLKSIINLDLLKIEILNVQQSITNSLKIQSSSLDQEQKCDEQCQQSQFIYEKYFKN